MMYRKLIIKTYSFLIACVPRHTFIHGPPVVHRLPFKFPYFFFSNSRKEKDNNYKLQGKKKRVIYKNNSSYRAHNFF